MLQCRSPHLDIDLIYILEKSLDPIFTSAVMKQDETRAPSSQEGIHRLAIETINRLEVPTHREFERCLSLPQGLTHLH
jgi:hypothetical protein